MMGSRKREIIEDFAIIGGLIGVQFMYAGNSVVSSYLMMLGFKPSSLIILSSLATFLILSPFSFMFERSQWPRGMSLKLLIELFLISFGGVTLFQSLFMKGIKLTSPAMATAMPNLAPGLIFLIAWAFGLEKVELRCKYSRAKIAGTLLCVTGAILMSLMQSSSNPKEMPSSPPDHKDNFFDPEKIKGSMYLMAAIVVLSSNIVLQAATLGDFPAPISLCAITSLIGMVLTGIVQLIQQGSLEIGLPLLSIRDLIGYSLLAGIVSGACVSFNNWAMKKRGPVLVSVFSPVGTVLTVVLSAITLSDTITMGSLAGMFLMFTGLYFVLWAKRKEGFLNNDINSSESEYDVEKPLLH
ncbi:WAT1-related protein At5g47470-like isoform X1 [Nicotiana tabacum]|uniref:WAT1-related protein n=1 Tax=Nicotiana tabacum TaxID=4097 RepID=A0A1S4BJQ2_TOBAC|nr:PREDICTED: WAT1-related protein At5g47470-like isoform X1 [Nicotiana tabacum]